MDLLEESINKNKKGKTQTQKIILISLIVSIILCLITALIIAYVSLQDTEVTYSVAVNGEKIDFNQLVMRDSSGKNYIAIKDLSSILGYNYYNGEYKVAEEGKNKGYVDTNKTIVQFVSDSKEIFKTTEDSKSDYEYYTLENTILEYEGKIYVAIDDLPVALNLILGYIEDKNQTTIESPEHWVEQRADAFKENNITISETPENLRALAYGYLVINKDNKLGVIDLSGNEIIGNKYNSLVFCEYKENFIVSDTQNKYGVISKSGISEINLQYDSFEIINFEPLLYKVERLEKYGVINQKGDVINEIKYDSIAYPENASEEINYTLIIPYINENIPQSIVVCSDKKYGIVEIETGREVLPCILEGIYSKLDNEDIYYAKMPESKEYLLETFVETYNQLTTAVD